MFNHSNLRETCPIEPLIHQKDHVEKIWNILVKDKVFSFIDTSKTGLGKTMTTLMLAWHLQKLYQTKVMIIAPSEASLNNDDGWLYHAKSNGIKIEISTTYSSLRGGQGTVSHPWLIPDSENKKKWIASQKFEKICSTGLFIIFDEFHHAKNQSVSHFACAALVKMAKKYRNVCRVGLLSHTPGDKLEVYPQILRMTGLITSTKMFKNVAFTSDYEIDGYGLGELKNLCIKLDPKSKHEIQRMFYRISKAKSNKICKELYEKYIHPIIVTAMIEPKKEYKTVMLNAFLESDEDGSKLSKIGIDILTGAVGWDAATQQVANANHWNLANIGIGLKYLERGKLYGISQYVNEEVRKNPHKKFVISCGARGIEHHTMLASLIYRKKTKEENLKILSELKQKNNDWKKLPKDMINYICSFLEIKETPHILNGQVDKKDRIKLIRDFQDNSNKCWCLIISPGIGSESISLHDKNGGRDRDMLISPDYHLNRIIQSCGRVNRVGMKSDTKVMIVYSKEANLETSVLNSMIRKTVVAKDMLAKGQKVVFPGEFPFWIQGESKKELEDKLNVLNM